MAAFARSICSAAVSILETVAAYHGQVCVYSSLALAEATEAMYIGRCTL